jgi:adenosylhomocysteine nucleosidase
MELNRFTRISPVAPLLLLGIALLVTGCTAPKQSAARTGKPLIAVMGAYSTEMKANREALLGTNAPASETVVNGVPFTRFTLAGHDVLLFPSGVSMVNAAMTTQLALDRFPITHVLFAGIAGGINPSNHIGDVVIPEKWFHHSEAVYANPKPDGSGHVLPEYFKPPYENFGFMFPDNVSAIRDGMEKPADQQYFPVDPKLLEVARVALAKMPPLVWGTNTARVSVGGSGIAGPVFMDNREYRKFAYRVWKAECLDMESTAIAQVCWANKVPFLIVRSLSDLAGGQEGVNAADTTEVPISKHASVVLREIIKAIPTTKP